MTIWLKLRGWLYGLIAAAGLMLAAWLLGRQKGKQSGEADAQAARNDAANAQAKAEQMEARHEVDAEVAKLPEAGPQKVADADPATAAGKLRDDGWLRE